MHHASSHARTVSTMTREIMREIKELILKGYSGRQIVALGYAESTVRRVGEMMALRGELSGISRELAKDPEVLKQIRRELRERGFQKSSIEAEVSSLRRGKNLVFSQPQVSPLTEGEYNRTISRLWEEYREKKARLLREYNEKVAQLRGQYEKAAWKKRGAEDRVSRLQAEIEVRDRLLKKLMERLRQAEEKQTREASYERRRPGTAAGDSQL